MPTKWANDHHDWLDKIADVVSLFFFKFNAFKQKIFKLFAQLVQPIFKLFALLLFGVFSVGVNIF